MSEGRAGHRRMRRRTLRRWALPSLAGVALVASMTVVVRRGEEARRLSGELGRLRSEHEIARDRLAEVTARLDSLGSLARLERVAGELGLRQAGEGEVFYLADVSARGNGTGEGRVEAER